MNERIIERIDEKIEACTRRLADDTVKLVRIRSVQSSAQTGAPFGKGVKIARYGTANLSQNELLNYSYKGEALLCSRTARLLS